MYTDITKIGMPVWIEVDICLSLVDFWHFVLIFLFVSLIYLIKIIIFVEER